MEVGRENRTVDLRDACSGVVQVTYRKNRPMIGVSSVSVGAEAEALVLEVLRSGQLAQGAFVERFERRFAEVHGVDHALAVNSGTTALVVALQALGIGPGDEVITSPFTFIATVNAILEAGATVRFGDVGDDFNLTPDSVTALINSKTRVIMPVHLYGYMCDMAAFSDLAATNGLSIVEDAAQAVGATFEGRAAGSFGIGCFSLYATKNVYTGEGGIVTTNDAEVADRVRLLRNHGMRERYQYEIAGHNYRLTNLAAAVGIPQLETIDSNNLLRQRNAKVLRDGLAGLKGLVVPPEPVAGRTHVYHQFTLRLTEESGVDREAFMQRLAERGVGSGVYYPAAAFDYDSYRNHPRVVRDSCPSTKRVAAEVVSIPVHPNLSEDDLSTIVDAVRTAVSS